MKSINQTDNKNNKNLVCRKPDDIDILILTCHDWCNTAYRYQKSLEAVGYKVKLFKGAKHKFGYPVQAELRKSIQNGMKNIQPNVNPVRVHISDDDELVAMIKRAKVINFHASYYFQIDGIDWKDKKIVVTHGGTSYRKHASICNSVFNNIASHTLIQCPDLLNKGAINEHLIYYAVDTHFIRPHFDFISNEYITIGHFPSKPAVKGTAIINKVIDELSKKKFKNKFKYVGIHYDKNHIAQHQVSWENQLKRLSQCDICIETCQAFLNGQPYGEWGNTCLEASALGKIVITNTHTKDIYLKEYTTDYPLIIANSESDLIEQLTTILNMDRSQLMELKQRFRRWVENNHSIKATGTRLKKTIYSKLI